MDSTNPKVSFIPKGSLVREESFLERRRPQSAIGFIAGTAFVLALSTYAGLYYYNDKLNQEVATKTIEIKKAQKEFSDEPKVAEAKVFRARADLARELLNSHTIASPVFTFLSENTIESVLYNKFSFKNSNEGAILEISGEAPTYSSLAYQADVLRSKSKELLKFSVSNVSLTKFGTVTFSFSMTFKPDYLLYTNNISSSESDIVATPANVAISTTTPPVIETTELVSPAPAGATSVVPAITATNAQNGSLPSSETGLASDWSVSPRDVATATPVASTESKQSVLKTLWLKFKFW